MPFPRFLTPMTAAGGAIPVPISPAGGSVGPATKLALTIQKQQQTDWCWAAVTASVADFFRAGSPWSQCDVANAALARQDCCTVAGSDPAKCNRPYYLETALDVTGHLARIAPRSLSFAEVQSEITSSRPLGCRIEWPDGTGHFLTIIGFTPGSSGVDYLDIADPIFLNSQIPFHDFATLYQTGATWTHSYLTSNAGIGGSLMAANQQRQPQHPEAIGA